MLQQCRVHGKVGASMLGVHTQEDLCVRTHEDLCVRTTQRCAHDRVVQAIETPCRNKDFSIATNLSSSQNIKNKK